MRRFPMYLAVLGLAMLGVGCGGDDDADPAPGSSSVTTTVAGESEVADLAVTFVRVYPGLPTVDQQFTVRAQVGNLGSVASEQYDIAGTVRNITTGDVYPVGAETMESMLPGEDYTVLQSDLSVTDAGSYQFWLEISPWGDDADDSNDAAGWAFTVGE